MSELGDVSVGHGVSLLWWRGGGVEHPHDKTPYLFIPSPTFSHSSSRKQGQQSIDLHGLSEGFAAGPNDSTTRTKSRRVRSNFLKKKLGLTNPDAELDAGMKEVAEKMKSGHTKNRNRVTVYYLLSEHFGKLSALS